MSKLYPPNIEGTIPAFSGDSLVVPFTMNKTVSQNNVRSFSLKIKTVQSNTLIKVATSTRIDFDSMEAYFTITGLTVGQYYKLQMAYVDNSGIVGYYSTVGVVKYTSTPSISISGLEVGKINMNSSGYLGVYSQYEQDVTEKVYSYCFTVTDFNGNLFATSGTKVHNSFEDTEICESTDKFTIEKELAMNETYYIQYEVITTNKMKVNSPRYRIMRRQSIDPEIQAELVAELNTENGYINLTLLGHKEEGTQLEIAATGAFLITRSSSKDNYGSWDNILKFVLHGQQASRWLWKDFTVEHGYTYQYSLQQYNDYELYSNRILSNTVDVTFEDSFLYDGEKQLKIKYNPKISSFKTNVQETKLETIGSQHPFIFRNGTIAYKEFPISGLISYQMDEENLFISKEDLGLDEITTNLTDKNVTSERIFKMKVLEFLTDGKPKVFRSSTEGNYIVRLMNSSLTPTDTVGRMLHTFSTTAYEIADYNYKELNNYNFLSVKDPSKQQMRWETIQFAYSNNDGTVSYAPSNTKLNNHVAAVVRLQDMMPGDLVSFDGNVIAIGATGNYYVDTGTSITDIRLVSSGEHQGSMIYGYYSDTQNKFDTITDINIEDIPLIQYIGEMDLFEELQDIKFTVEGFYVLHFAKREVVEVYTDNADAQLWLTPTKKETLTDFNIFNMYLVKNLDRVPNFENYYIDGQTQAKIALKDYSNMIYINGVPMDLTETVTYTIHKPQDITSLQISNGIMAECSVQRKEMFYKVEESNPVKGYRDAYLDKLNTLLNIIYGTINQDTGLRVGVNIDEDYAGNIEQYNALVDQCIRQRDEAYDAFISNLNIALKQQEEEMGK